MSKGGHGSSRSDPSVIRMGHRARGSDSRMTKGADGSREKRQQTRATVQMGKGEANQASGVGGR